MIIILYLLITQMALVFLNLIKINNTHANRGLNNLACIKLAKLINKIEFLHFY